MYTNRKYDGAILFYANDAASRLRLNERSVVGVVKTYREPCLQIASFVVGREPGVKKSAESPMKSVFRRVRGRRVIRRWIRRGRVQRSTIGVFAEGRSLVEAFVSPVDSQSESAGLRSAYSPRSRIGRVKSAHSPRSF